MLVKGVPRRLQVVWSYRLESVYSLEVVWAPNGFDSEPRFHSNPVHIEVTSDSDHGCGTGDDTRFRE